MQISGSEVQLPGRQTVDDTYKTDIAPLSSSPTTLKTHEFKTSRIQNPSLTTLSLPTTSMESHNDKSGTTGKPSATPPLPSQTTPEESPATLSTTHAQMEQANPATTTTAPALPPVSGIPTEMGVKLFQFLQPDIDIGHVFAQFVATPVATPQSEAMGKGDDGELLSTTQRTEEKKDEEKEKEVATQGAPDERVAVEEALAIIEIPKEMRLEVETEKDVAVEATEIRNEGAGEATEQANPME